uniref:Large ribosomal subunit protein uL13c n=1 Tax=Helminthocladia australis TaxID=260093 RepID=A0A1G4NTK5_9FLOR|nr:Ribosomal protein L13 [Helminthocladia australis]SCW22021.1 Ribosomal protein L13 [Helminthocladia australis]
MNKTLVLNSNKEQKWHLIDAKGHKVGRLATEIATILRGKKRVTFHPSQNSKDYVVIINSKALEVTGSKAVQKLYYKHSGRPGSLKQETFETLQKRLPNKILENAVRKMLPKGPLGRQLFKNLKVYAGNTHPHIAQNPINIQID